MKVPGLHWHADGYAAMSGPLLALAQALDRRLSACAGRALEEHAAPTLIALEDLAPVGYLRSFPHLATFAASLEREPQAIARFAASHEGAGRLGAGAPVEKAGHVMTPAACYHLYHLLRGQELATDLYLTLRAPCHRREETFRPLERQWCFQMRELVCIGAPGAVAAFVQRCEAGVDALTRDLEIDARWVEAADPFFDAWGDPKALAQRIEPVKRELVLADGLAIASINRHRAFFGERYRIARSGAPAHSACVAFGIERWVLAIVRSRGADPARWRLEREVIA